MPRQIVGFPMWRLISFISKDTVAGKYGIQVNMEFKFKGKNILVISAGSGMSRGLESGLAAPGTMIYTLNSDKAASDDFANLTKNKRLLLQYIRTKKLSWKGGQNTSIVCLIDHQASMRMQSTDFHR